MKTSRRRGFTLVELLVVISIIGVLVSLIMPSLQGARNQARSIVCQAQLKDLRDALWAYSVEHEGRLPFAISPMTNGGAIGPDNQPVPGFGDGVSSNDMIDPFDRKHWPLSLPNLLFPGQSEPARRLFSCPAAVIGFPRGASPLTMTYRPSSANQLGGAELTVAEGEFDYVKEHFGFLDGRKIKQRTPPRFIEEPQTVWDHIHNAYQAAFAEAVFLRDMVGTRDDQLVGPHAGGTNVINRRFEVEYRDAETIQKQLQSQGVAVRF